MASLAITFLTTFFAFLQKTENRKPPLYAFHEKRKTKNEKRP